MALPDNLACKCISVYEDALTYGRRYDVVDSKEDKIRIKNDVGRTRWYPKYCFDLSGKDVRLLTSIHIDDPLPSRFPVEVTVKLSKGYSRWCWFATPRMLANCGDELAGTKVRFHYSHIMIVVSEISEEIIEKMLRHLECQGELMQYTKALSR